MVFQFEQYLKFINSVNEKVLAHMEQDDLLILLQNCFSFKNSISLNLANVDLKISKESGRIYTELKEMDKKKTQGELDAYVDKDEKVFALRESKIELAYYKASLNDIITLIQQSLDTIRDKNATYRKEIDFK